MNYNQQAPLQGKAEELASYGRYGDSMLVHMNPIEVEGIASLTPGGLTTNPVTGQPEAFAFLIPMLASMAAPAALTGLGTATGIGALTALGGNAALAGAIGSGLATTALTGDLKKGLVSGLTGYGVGSALGAAKEAVAGVPEAAEAASAATSAVEAAQKQAALQAVEQGGTQTLQEAFKSNQPLQDLISQQATAKAAETAAMEAAKDVGIRNVLGSKEGLKALGSSALDKSTLIPVAVGSGLQGQIDMQEQSEALGRRLEEEKRRDKEKYEGILSGSLAQIGADYGLDMSGAGYQGGGVVSLNPQNYQRSLAEAQMLGMQQPMGMRMGRKVKTEQKEKEESKAQEETANYQRFEDLMANMPFGSAASSAVRLGPAAAAMRQAQLRGPEVISPEELKGYRPGIDPEIMYFREKTKETEPYDPDAGPRFDPGDVPDDFFENLRFGLGELAGRGILTDGMLDQFQADLTTEGVEQFISRDPAARTTDYTDIYDFEARPMAAGGSTSVDPLINQTIMAVLGRLPEEDAEVVISRFIDEYGTEAFQMLRNQALRSVVPGAQTEGLIEGEGGGMDDQVPGMIGDQQRVAVSPGEYIIPADVVSATGDGSTDAGAERFDQMIDAIRMEKTGTMEQPEPLGAR
tara:strand:- start:2737 stop:4641 length:1905 start_codon:yes stop_codon:yes gene_type:complete